MAERKLINYISSVKVVSLIGVILFHCTLFYADNPFFPESAEFSSKGAVVFCELCDAILIASFVLCSGYLFAYSTSRKTRTIPQSLLERVKRLLVPYYIYGAVWVVPLYTFFNIQSFGRPENAGYLTGYKYMLLGCFSDHLWFLWMLFWVAAAFILLRPLMQKKYLPLLFCATTALALIVQFFLADFPYFKLSQIAPYLICYFVGICAFMFREKLEALPVPLIFGISAVTFVCCFFYNQAAAAHFALMWLCKLAGGLCFFFLFLGLDRLHLLDRIRQTKLWNYTEAHSVSIYLLNCPFMYLYFRLLYPAVGQSVLLCVGLNFIMCMLSLYLCVWIQDTVKKIIMPKRRNHAVE